MSTSYQVPKCYTVVYNVQERFDTQRMLEMSRNNLALFGLNKGTTNKLQQSAFHQEWSRNGPVPAMSQCSVYKVLRGGRGGGGGVLKNQKEQMKMVLAANMKNEK